MPLYMDLHKGMKGLSRKDVEHAHLQDVKVQDKYGVKYHKFWMNEETRTIFCLIEGPSKEACEAVHREAQGEVGCEIIEVHPSYISVHLGDGKATPIGVAVHPVGKIDSAIRTFLFTDIVDSTNLTSKYGDATAISILRTHNQIVRDCLQKNNGKEVKHTGDGIMAVFVSSSKAVRCALEIQSILKEYRTLNPDIPLHIRIGINAGEPVTEGDDFFGAAVQLTKRICDLAEPDVILTSGIIKGLCIGKEFQFQKFGDHSLKGFPSEFEVFKVE